MYAITITIIKYFNILKPFINSEAFRTSLNKESSLRKQGFKDNWVTYFFPVQKLVLFQNKTYTRHHSIGLRVMSSGVNAKVQALVPAVTCCVILLLFLTPLAHYECASFELIHCSNFDRSPAHRRQ